LRITYAASGQPSSQIDIAPGAACIVGTHAITWSKIEETNESLGMYPNMGLLRRLANWLSEYQPFQARIRAAYRADARRNPPGRRHLAARISARIDLSNGNNLAIM
jgi:hypothetical protein